MVSKSLQGGRPPLGTPPLGTPVQGPQAAWAHRGTCRLRNPCQCLTPT